MNTMTISKEEYDRLKEIEAAVQEWFAANQDQEASKKEDNYPEYCRLYTLATERWLAACKKMDTLMGGTWEAEECNA